MSPEMRSALRDVARVLLRLADEGEYPGSIAEIRAAIDQATRVFLTETEPKGAA